MKRRGKTLGVRTGVAVMALVAAMPAMAGVERAELDIAGYLCGF